MDSSGVAVDVRDGDSGSDARQATEAVRSPTRRPENRRRAERWRDRAGLFERDRGRRSEEHTSELQSLAYLVCRLLLEKKKKKIIKLFNEKKKKKNTQKCS